MAADLVAIVQWLGPWFVEPQMRVQFPLATPPELSGRMSATMRWFVWGTTLGPRETLLIAGVGGSFALNPLLFGQVWKI